MRRCVCGLRVGAGLACSRLAAHIAGGNPKRTLPRGEQRLRRGEVSPGREWLRRQPEEIRDVHWRARWLDDGVVGRVQRGVRGGGHCHHLDQLGTDLQRPEGEVGEDKGREAGGGAVSARAVPGRVARVIRPCRGGGGMQSKEPATASVVPNHGGRFLAAGGCAGRETAMPRVGGGCRVAHNPAESLGVY